MIHTQVHFHSFMLEIYDRFHKFNLTERVTGGLGCFVCVCVCACVCECVRLCVYVCVFV